MADNDSVVVQAASPAAPQPRTPTRSATSTSAVQRRTFTRWINAHLSRLPISGEGSAAVSQRIENEVNDLTEDLRDGRRLLLLLKVLTGESLKQEKGRMRVHHIANLNRALRFLEDRYGLKFVNYNISAEDLADGSPTLTLGFVWRLILCFQVQIPVDPQADDQGAKQKEARSKPGKLQRQATTDNDLKQDLLAWCRETTAACPEVSVRDFKSSWQDGLAFLAIMRHYCPQKVGQWPPSSSMSAADISRLAFKLAESEFGIYPLLDADEVASGIVDDLSMMTYVAMMRQELASIEAPPVKEAPATVEESLQQEAALEPPVSEPAAIAEEHVSLNAIPPSDLADLPGFELQPVDTSAVEDTDVPGDNEPGPVTDKGDKAMDGDTVQDGPATVVEVTPVETEPPVSSTTEEPEEAASPDAAGVECADATTTTENPPESEFVWWPWLGLIPLVLSGAFQIAKSYRYV